MAEWQPIDAAPKDGTEILCFIDFGDGSWVMKIMTWTDDGWREWGDQSYDLDGSEVSHWMNLPDPPKSR